MSKKKTHFFEVITLVLYGVPIAMLVILALYVINPSGIRTYHYTLDKRSPAISQLFPAQRLAGVHNGSQKVLVGPIYTWVKYPRAYKTLAVTVDVDSLAQSNWTLGLEVQAGGEWAYHLEAPDENGTALFDLANAKVTDRQIRLMISPTQESLDDNFFIKSITARFEH